MLSDALERQASSVDATRPFPGPGPSARGRLRHRKANVRNIEGEEQVPPVLQGERLKPFISNELLEKSKPIAFQTPQGIRASGYRAEILPEICDVYLRARDAGALFDRQMHIAVQADILIRGLAKVGIIALVDEATGYQSMRARDALANSPPPRPRIGMCQRPLSRCPRTEGLGFLCGIERQPFSLPPKSLPHPKT
jgi:hypothetical protein